SKEATKPEPYLEQAWAKDKTRAGRKKVVADDEEAPAEGDGDDDSERRGSWIIHPT
ncbi:hypothetical protein H0H92_010625, partial [Tricholoma furcatifolium]